MAQKVFASAGVYTSEDDMSVRASLAGMTVIGFVGECAKGAANEIVDYYSIDQLLAACGNPDIEKYGASLYCAMQALKGADHIKFMRVCQEDALTAGAFWTIDDPAATSPVNKIRVFDGGSQSNEPKGVYDPAVNLNFLITDSANGNTPGAFYASSPGSWTTSEGIAIGIRPSNPAGIDVSETQHYNPNHFYVDVYVGYKNTSSRPKETFLVSREVELSADGKQLFIETALKRSNYIRFKNNPLCGQVPVKTSALEFITGGSDGSRANVGSILAAWDKYNDSEAISLNTIANGGYTDPRVHRKMIQVAEDRFDTVAILDLPHEAEDPADAYSYMNNELNRSSSFSGMYAPFLKVRDTINGKNVLIPPSGNVASTFASTHKNAQIWGAPAGITNATLTILGISRKYRKGERGTMDDARVNIVRKLPNRGFVIMGQDTMQQEYSTLSNINARRLINQLKTTIANAATISTFTPGDRTTRLGLIDICKSALRPIRAGGGLYDYEVICDSRNNPNESVAVGDLNIDVILDPSIPQKRIHLTNHITPTGTYADEL